MKKHECIVGILNNYDFGELVTLAELERNINERREYNKRIDGKAEHFKYIEWSLKDYADRRKSTNLTAFSYCPYCGKEIDWKAIKNK